MKKIIVRKDGSRMEIESTPKCGDYCDICGSCLHCQWEDECVGNEPSNHAWVEYEFD